MYIYVHNTCIVICNTNIYQIKRICVVTNVHDDVRKLWWFHCIRGAKVGFYIAGPDIVRIHIVTCPPSVRP